MRLSTPRFKIPKSRMRILLVLVWSFLVVVQTGWSQATGQTITIRESSISVGDLLEEISRQSGVQFSYNPRAIRSETVLSFKVRKAGFEEVLQQLSTQTSIDYRWVEGQVVLRPRVEQDTEIGQLPERLFHLSGFVADKRSGESLPGANVFIEGTSTGTNTNEFGFFSLQLPPGSYTLACSYLGYEQKQFPIELQRDVQKDLRLEYQTLTLPDVLVEVPMAQLLEARQVGQLRVAPEEIEQLPEFGGESGLVRGLQSLPGISMHSDGSAFFFVRGGNRDQNLIIIDDAPIYNPAHLFGFYSLVVPEFTKAIEVYKSDMPVYLGDRLSSIVDVRTKDGNLHRTQFSGSFNPLVSRLSLEGPFKKERSSYFASIRRSNMDWIYSRAAPALDLQFGDFQFKWNYKVSDRDRIFFTLINSRDQLENESAGIRWNNFAMTLRWNRIVRPNLFVNTVLYTGNYQYNLSSFRDVWASGIANLSLKSTFTHYHPNSLTSRYGGEIQSYSFNPGRLRSEALQPFFPTIRQDHSRHSVLFYQLEYPFAERWLLSAGARFSVWANIGPATYYQFDEAYQVSDTLTPGAGVYNRYARLDPRGSLQYQLGENSQLKWSAGVYHQFIQLISNSTSPFTSFETWLPSSPNIRPQRALQSALGYVRYWKKAGLQFGAEAYYKHMSNQIDYRNHAHTLLNPLIEGELRFGQIRAYGLELLLKKEQGRLNGWISYTRSRSIMQSTVDVNNGEAYPNFQDRPNELSVVLNYQIARRILFSGYWTSFTGSPFSSPTGFISYQNYTVPVYGEKHNDRLPDYRRLDIGMQFQLNRRAESRYQHQLEFSIYNVLARANVVDVNFNKILRENGTPVVRADLLAERALVTTQTDLIRFFPSLTYTFNL